MPRTLYSINQVAQLTDTPRHVIDYAVTARHIPARKIGTHWIFSQKNLEAVREYLRTKKRIHRPLAGLKTKGGV